MASTTVTVSSTTTTTKLSPNIHFDPNYIRTISGILKIAQIIVNLVGFICSQASYATLYHSSAGWYSFVSMTAFWVTLVLLILYLFHIIEKLHVVPWLLGELGFCGVWAAFYFIAGVIAAINGPSDPAWGAAAFFAFVAMGLYGYDAFEKFKGWRAGAIAQGERTTTTSNTTAASPTSPSYPAY